MVLSFIKEPLPLKYPIWILNLSLLKCGIWNLSRFSAPPGSIEFIRCKISELNFIKKEPKGELTIVISEKKNFKNNSHLLSESDKINIRKMINTLSVKEITKLINQNSKVSKKEIYNYCLKIKNEK